MGENGGEAVAGSLEFQRGHEERMEAGEGEKILETENSEARGGPGPCLV